jgi:hypothetical protein
MSLEEASQIGELIASIGVLISLVYLAVQVKQNTKALQMDTARSAAAELADANNFTAENEGYAEIFFRGVQDIESLEGVERMRFYAGMHKFFRSHENTHYQYINGALSAARFQSISSQFASVISTPGLQAYWADRKNWYSAEFQDWVEQTVSSSSDVEFNLAGSPCN